MAGLTITSGRVAQFAEIQEIERAADRLFPEDRLPSGETLTQLQLAAALDEGLLWTATLNDRICGFALAQNHADWLYLQQVSVHPRAGRKGIGRKLVEQVVKIARERSRTGVALTTFADFSWNAPFYRSLGFVDWNSTPEFIAAKLEAERRSGMTERIGMIRSSDN